MSEMISVRQPRLLLKELSQDGVHLKEAARLHPLSQPMELNARFMSTATLTLPESDPELVLHDLVELYTAKGSAGIFWVVGQEPNYGTNRVYKLNHAIDILSASTYPGNPAGEETYNSIVSGFISELLSAQKQKIGNTPFWQLGTCEDTGFWYKEISYDNVLEDLSELEKDHEDYHFTFDFSTFPWTLNFVRFSGAVVSEFRLSRNVSNARISLNDDNLCTKLYLSVTTKATVTQNDQDAGEVETTEYLSFENAAGIAQWGVIERAQGIEADKEPDTQDFVQRYFRKHSAPELTITIDGEEIYQLTGESIDEANLGGICRVAIPKYTVFFNERILSVRYPDAKKTPLRINASISNKRKDMAGSIASVRKTASTAASTATSALRTANNNSTKLKKLAYEFQDETGNLRSMIEMNERHLLTQFQNLEEGLTSRFEQTAEHFQWSLEDAKRELYSSMELTAEHLTTDFDDKINHLHSTLELTAAHLQTMFEDGDRGLLSRLELTAEHLQTRFDDRINDLHSEFEITAAHMKAVFGDIARGLESSFELSAEHMQATFDDKVRGLQSEFVLNAAHLRTEFQNTTDHLQAALEVNAQHLNYATTKADENGRILAAAGISIDTNGNVLYNYNIENGVGTRLQQNDHAIGTVVGYTVTNGNRTYFVKAGEVVDSINAQTGQTVHKVDMDMITLKNNAIIGCINNGPGTGETAMTINFNRLNLTSGAVIKLLNGGGNNASTLTIDTDKLNLTGYLQTNGLGAAIADLGTVNMSAARISGNETVFGGLFGQEFYVITSTSNSGGTTTVGNTSYGLSNAVRLIEKNLTPPSGQIGIRVTPFVGNAYTVNFNIADTQTYIDGVSAARNSVTPGIVDGNNDAVSGQHTLASGSSLTLYPAKYIGGTFDSKNTNAAVVITAQSQSQQTPYIVTLKDGSTTEYWRYDTYNIYPGDTQVFYPATWDGSNWVKNTNQPLTVYGYASATVKGTKSNGSEYTLSAGTYSLSSDNYAYISIAISGWGTVVVQR